MCSGYWQLNCYLSDNDEGENDIKSIDLFCLSHTHALHHPVDPPSTRKSVPVTYELASASRNTTAPRYSSGTEILLSMASCSQTVVHSLCVRTSFVIGVWMTPGLMEFTRMAGEEEDEEEEEPHSPARERVSWWTPALEAE